MGKLLLMTLAFLSAAPALASDAHKTSSGFKPQVAVDIAGPVLMVADLERSLKFYVDGLGMKASNRLPGNPGPGATVVSSEGQAAPFLLIRQIAANAVEASAIVHGNGLSRVMIVVSDSGATAARLSAAGYSPGPINARGIFFVKDPDGYNYEVIQRGAHH